MSVHMRTGPHLYVCVWATNNILQVKLFAWSISDLRFYLL